MSYIIGLIYTAFAFGMAFYDCDFTDPEEVWSGFGMWTVFGGSAIALLLSIQNLSVILQTIFK